MKYQTLSEFLRCPFGKARLTSKVTEYERAYRNSSLVNKIHIEGYMESSGAYYVHVKVPSESNKNEKYYYDVIIRFFTDDPMIAKQNSLNEYYIQFFSNSPGFIYRYATIYRKEGYLIDLLYDKMDPEYRNTLPEKTNEKMELGFDKSIFFACKYLSGIKFGVLNKAGILLQKKKQPNKFFDGISSFQSVKFDRELMEADKRLQKAMSVAQKNVVKRKNDIHLKKSVTSTVGTGKSVSQIIQKTKPKGRVSKKMATKSTRRK